MPWLRYLDFWIARGRGAWGAIEPSFAWQTSYHVVSIGSLEEAVSVCSESRQKRGSKFDEGEIAYCVLVIFHLCN